MQEKLTDEVNKWFISPHAENKEYITKFFNEITNQLIREKSLASSKELVPACTEDCSFIEDLDSSHSQEEIIEKLDIIYNQSMNASSVGYIGQMDSIPNIGAILGDFVTAAINNNMLANEMSPFFSWLETELVKKFSQWFGFGKKAGGVMTDGGTLANMQALTVARNVKLSIASGNLFTVKKQPVLFASQHAHASVLKAGMLLGIGSENVITIATEDNGRMSVESLELAINKSIEEGKLPFAVVSTYGTTNAGAIDDVNKVQEICEKHNLWHHIDAIYGGAMALSETQTHLCPDFNKADSLAFNPQKWMFVAKTCSILLFRDFDAMENNFKVSAPYVKQGNKTNLGEYGIQGSRHTSVLKLWMSLYLIGKKQYAKIIDLNMEVTKLFSSYIINHEQLTLYTDPDLNIILFRPIQRAYQSEEEYVANLSKFQEFLYEKNNYISLIPWEGELWLKCVFLNPYFDHSALDKLQSIINAYFDEQ